MILFAVSIFLLTVFLFQINNYLSFLNKIEKILPLYIITSAYIILIIEVAGLLNSLNKPLVILTIQLVINCFAFITLKMLRIKWKGVNIKEIKYELSRAKSYIIKYWGLSIYAGIILIVYLFLLYVEIRFPQNTSDSMYNHLSRIGYWLQQGSLKTYFGFSNYGTTYPYNNSLLMIWSVIFLKSDKLVGLVQYFATLFLALTIFLTGNELGFTKKGKCACGINYAYFPDHYF